MAEEKTNQSALAENLSARQKYLSRIQERVKTPVDWEDEESRYNAYLQTDDEQQNTINRYQESNQKLADMFSKNPRFAALMRDVMKGEDPSVVFVRYFGQDALDAAGNEEKLKLITEANKEYLNRVAESEKLAKTQEENLNKSQEEMLNFQKEKGINDQQFAQFIDAIYNTLEKGLEGLLTRDFMDIFWNGLNYENDIQDAVNIGKTEARNEKIKFENRVNKGDNIPNLREGSGTGQHLPPPQKHRSFYDGGPAFAER